MRKTSLKREAQQGIVLTYNIADGEESDATSANLLEEARVPFLDLKVAANLRVKERVKRKGNERRMMKDHV